MAFATYQCGDAQAEFPVHVLEDEKALFENRFFHQALPCQNPCSTNVYTDIPAVRVFRHVTINVPMLWRWEEPNSQCAVRLKALEEAQHHCPHDRGEYLQRAIVFIVSGDDVSWQHFMQDALPLLAACRSHLAEQPDLVLLFPQKKDHIVYMLDVLGITNRVRWLNGTTVHVRELYVPTFMPDNEAFWKRHVPSKWRMLVAQLLQQHLAQITSCPKQDSLVYLTRNNCGQRRVHNEEAVLTALRRYAATRTPELSVVVFNHAEYPDLEQRFLLFYHAKVIVAPHGGAVYHIYATQPHTAMVEIVSGSGPLSCSVAHMATAIQLRYYMQLAPDGSHSGVGYNLNIQHLLACLKESEAAKPTNDHQNKLFALEEQSRELPVMSAKQQVTGLMLRSSARVIDLDTGPMVSILCPTRKRPTQLRKSLLTLSTLANHPERIEFLLGVDLDDTDTIQSLPGLQTEFQNCREVYFPRRHGYHQLHLYINRLCTLSTAPLLFLWNDDAEMETKGWDDILWRASVDTNHPVYAFFAYHNGNATTEFPVISRSFYTVTGHFSLNAHNDTWIEDVLRPLQLFKHIPIYVRHLRYDPNPQARAALSYADTQQSEQISKREYYSTLCHEQRHQDTEVIRQFCTMKRMLLNAPQDYSTQTMWTDWLANATDWLVQRVQKQQDSVSCVIRL